MEPETVVEVQPQELAVIPQDGNRGLSVKEVKAQISHLHRLMKAVMIEDEHFGVIPGTKKKTLYKAGAEKIGLTFRLIPEYEVRENFLPNGHLVVSVKCVVRQINTGQIWGEGVAMCSTMESKYRYRDGDGEDTGRVVPKTYWDLRKSDAAKAQELLGGKEFKAQKVDGVWKVCKKGSKVEHDNPADYYNTVTKIAKKRAHVDAIITATAASDLFTQDLNEAKEPPID